MMHPCESWVPGWLGLDQSGGLLLAEQGDERSEGNDTDLGDKDPCLCARHRISWVTGWSTHAACTHPVDGSNAMYWPMVTGAWQRRQVPDRRARMTRVASSGIVMIPVCAASTSVCRCVPCGYVCVLPRRGAALRAGYIWRAQGGGARSCPAQRSWDHMVVVQLLCPEHGLAAHLAWCALSHGSERAFTGLLMFVP